jgi:hypothetical protein
VPAPTRKTAHRTAPIATHRRGFRSFTRQLCQGSYAKNARHRWVTGGLAPDLGLSVRRRRVRPR